MLKSIHAKLESKPRMWEKFSSLLEMCRGIFSTINGKTQIIILLVNYKYFL